MCCTEDKRSEAIPLEAIPLEAIPVKSIRIAITTHARRQFTKRFPAPKAPNELDEHLRNQVRQSAFLEYCDQEPDRAKYDSKYWEFVLALNPLRGGDVEAVVISCWRMGVKDRDNRQMKSKKYRRFREKQEWRGECL